MVKGEYEKNGKREKEKGGKENGNKGESGKEGKEAQLQLQFFSYINFTQLLALHSMVCLNT